MYVILAYCHVCGGHFNKIFVDIASKVGKRIELNLSGKHFLVYIHTDDVFNFPGDSSFQNLIRCKVRRKRKSRSCRIYRVVFLLVRPKND